MSNSVEQTDEQAPLLSGTNPPNYSPAEQFEFTALAPRGLSFASVQNRSENVIKGLTFHALNVLEESAKKVMDQPITTKVELSEIVENTGMKISALKEKLTNLKTKFSDKTLIDQAILAMDGINENGVFHSIYKSEHNPQSMSEREFVYVIFVKINSLDCKYILAAQHFKKERNKVQIGFGALTTTVGIGALYTMSLPLTMPFVVSAGVVGGLLTVGGLAMTVSGANNTLDPCTSDHIENWMTLKLVKKNSIKMDQNNQCYIANF